MASQSPPAAASAASSPYQEQLTNFCRSRGILPPTWQVVSDRRGGRTAWSCTVHVDGADVAAQFWYDGQYVHRAKEDASQVALVRLGQIPAQGRPPAHIQQPQAPPPQPQSQQQYQHMHQYPFPQGRQPQQSPQPQFQQSQLSREHQRFYSGLVPQ